MRSERERLIFGTGWTLASTLIGMIVGLALNFMVVAFLSVSGYGEWASALALASLFGLAGDLGVAGALTKVVAGRQGKDESMGSLVTTALIFGIIAGTVAGAALALGSIIVAQSVTFADYSLLLRILALQMPVNLGASSLLALLQGRRAFRVISILTVAQSTGALALTGLLLAGGFGISGVVLAPMIVSTATFGFLVYHERSVLVLMSWREFLADLRTLVPFGLQLVLTNGFSTVLYQADIVILSLWTDNAALVGAYAVAVFLTRGLWIIPSSISSTTYPVISEYRAARNEGRIGRYLSTAFLASVAVTGALSTAYILFGQPAIRLLFGPQAAPAYGLGLVLLLGTAALGVMRSVAPSLPAVGRPDVGLWISALGAGTLALLSVYMIGQWGALGAAVAVSSTFVVVACILGWSLRHFVLQSEHVFLRSRRLLATGALSVVAGLVCLLTAPAAGARILDLGPQFALWVVILISILFISGGRATWSGLLRRRRLFSGERE